jgi:hypothetical protein
VRATRKVEMKGEAAEKSDADREGTAEGGSGRGQEVGEKERDKGGMCVIIKFDLLLFPHACSSQCPKIPKTPLNISAMR